MNLRLEWMIGIRYLMSKRSSRTLSLNTVISLTGVTLGVAALIATLAVMTGFKEDMQEKILGTNSHIVVVDRVTDGIENYQDIIPQIKDIKGVTGVSPFIFRQVLLSYNKTSSGVIIRGIDPQMEKQTTDVDKYLLIGSIDSLSKNEDVTADGYVPKIIIGKEIALRLGAYIGDKITVISPEGEISPLGIIPKMKKFEVSGIFEAGMYEYDSGLAYISIKDAQKFFNLDENITGIEVKIKDIFEAERVSTVIEEKLGERYLARDWQKLNKNLFSALKLEKIMMFIILTLIILVASFNIVGTLSMIVVEKAKETAILKTMGATDGSVMRIFIIEGMLIGIVGLILGIPLGIAVCSLLQNIYSLPSDVYYIDHIPVNMKFSDVIMVSLSALFISLAATIYPSRQAAKTNPADALRYE